MMNFRKIAAASKGRLVLRYFTENKPEPIHPPALDAAGRQLDEGGRPDGLLHRSGRPGRLAAGHAGHLARAIGIDPYLDAARRRDGPPLRGAAGRQR